MLKRQISCHVCTAAINGETDLLVWPETARLVAAEVPNGLDTDQDPEGLHNYCSHQGSFFCPSSISLITFHLPKSQISKKPQLYRDNAKETDLLSCLHRCD